jgi:hypothetical protein
MLVPHAVTVYRRAAASVIFVRLAQKHPYPVLLLMGALFVVWVAPAGAAKSHQTSTTAGHAATTTKSHPTTTTVTHPTTTTKSHPTTTTVTHPTTTTTSGSTGTPCWKLLLNEWYGGAITTIYPLHCYTQAIDHLPADIAVYSSAKDDIQAAELAATRGKAAPPEKTKLPPTITTALGSGGTPDQNPPKKKHGVAGLLADITPGNPQSFPLPLLVLGALAILLVVAGGAGMVWQRSHPSGPDIDSDVTQT